MAPDWRRYSFDWQAGRPAVLIIAPPDSFTEVAPTIAGFDAASPMFEVRNADVLVLSTPDQADMMRALLASDSRVQLIDCNSDLIAESGATEGEIVVGVVDRNLRVALRCNPGSPDVYTADCLECLDRLVPAVPAPVLILPNVLPHICRTLVDRFEPSNSVEGKVAGVDPAGMPTCYVNRALKSRRDFQFGGMILWIHDSGGCFLNVVPQKSRKRFKRRSPMRTGLCLRGMMLRMAGSSGIATTQRQRCIPPVCHNRKS
jgi:hypothetical protein